MQSIKSSYGLEHGNRLEKIDDYLSKNKKNVLLMVLDGMGKTILESTLNESSWLRKHTKDFVTSVYPSTTTAAMTTFYSGKMPIEHGWLGWSLYFKEYSRVIDTFLNSDSYTGDSVGNLHAAETLLQYETIFDQIMKNELRPVQTYSFNPRGIIVAKEPTINVQVDSFEEMINNIETISKLDGHKFMMAYWSDPDHSIHSKGCGSDYVREIMVSLDSELKRLACNLKDTLLIITADHGLVDIEKKFYIDDYKTIEQCLMMPPSIETRCASFFVKEDYKEQFVTEFNKNLGDEFKLLTKKEFLSGGYLGHKTAHYKVDDFVGNYVALATGRSMIQYRTYNQTIIRNHKANHAGLLEEEMIVPIVIYDC